MLVRLTKATRRCAAMLIGALYALCVIMPSASVALGGGDRPVHCFTDEQLGLTHVPQTGVHQTGLHQAGAAHAHAEGHAQAHVHADGTTHDLDGAHHPAPSDNRNDPAACCGLFGLTAMAVDPQLVLDAPSRHASILPVSFETLTGRGPDRINRPPIVLLSL
jgi:hypothetical protein